MAAVKDAMGHGNLSDESYGTVWEECFNEVLFIPSQNRLINYYYHKAGSQYDASVSVTMTHVTASK